MKAYHELSRLGQLRRMRKLAETALIPYGMENSKLTFLRHFANTTYRVDLPQKGSSKLSQSHYLPDRYLLRVLVSSRWEYALGEMTWLAALSKEAGLPVPAPVPNQDGELLTKVVTEGIPEGRIVSMMRWIDGRKPGHISKPEQFFSWGRLVAQLHAFAASWQLPDGFERYIWDWEGLLGKRYLGEGVHGLVNQMPEHLQEPFQIVSAEVKSVMQLLGNGRDVYGLVHGDMYPDNILVKGADIRIIDFEDCGFGYWLWDIAIALENHPWTELWYQQRDAFLEGYTQVHPLPDSQLQHLDLFLAVDYATVLIWATQFMQDEPGRYDEYETWREENGRNLLRYFDRKVR